MPQYLFRHAAEAEVAFLAMAGHDHHIHLLFLYQIQDLLGGITDRDMLNVDPAQMMRKGAKIG